MFIDSLFTTSLKTAFNRLLVLITPALLLTLRHSTATLETVAPSYS